MLPAFDPEFVARTERVQLRLSEVLAAEFPDEPAHILASALSYQIGEIVVKENVRLERDETDQFATLLTGILRLHVDVMRDRS